MRKVYLLICSLCILTVASSQSNIVLVADRDNTIYSESVSKSNGAGQNLITGVTGGGNKRRALIHFDLSSIPAGATINSVSLSLHCNNIPPAGGTVTVELHKVQNDWGQGTSDAGGAEGTGTNAVNNDATWGFRFFNTTNWSVNGGDFLSTVSASTGVSGTGPVNFSGAGLLNDVVAWRTTPSSNFGWIILTGETGTTTGRRFASRENPTTAQRPQLTVNYTPGSFPVSLKSFNAALKNNSAILEWKTATEINNKYFDIEHSSDGAVFSSVGRVNGNGNSTKEITYTFTHSNLTAGKHYYRLAQYDFDGTLKYSQVVLLSRTKGAQLQVTPNPATSFIKLTASTALSGATFFITSATGQVVKNGTLTGQQIDVQQLPAGQYWLSVEAKGDVFKTGFLKR